MAAGPRTAGPPLLHRHRGILWATGLALAAGFYLAGVPENRLAFYIDESSIAYNAYTISASGCDEHGIAWPLYFRAFGEYKNPTFIYLLAALFKLFGPGILLARLLSATLGLLAMLLLGLLTARMCGSRGAGVLVALTGLVTPWLFEVSRLVFEVALYPLVLVLFLLTLHRSHTRARWSAMDSIGLAAALAALTYTYSIGRLLGPLLAFGLILFVRPGRWMWLIRTWGAYALTLTPLLVFSLNHPGSLSTRFRGVSGVTQEGTWPGIAMALVEHYVSDLSPRGMLLVGDANLTHHVPGMGSLLAATAALALAGLALLVWKHRGDPWWRFILYGLAVSVVPASLTDDRFHTLRLIALPLFLLLMTGLAWAWLLEKGENRTARRAMLVVLVALTVAQGALFQRQYYQIGPRRDFDQGYLDVFAAATAAPNRPLHLLVGPGRFGYVHAYWYGTLRRMDTSRFVRLAPGARPPAGALVVSEAEAGGCVGCQVIRQKGLFIAYTTRSEPNLAGGDPSRASD